MSLTKAGAGTIYAIEISTVMGVNCKIVKMIVELLVVMFKLQNQNLAIGLQVGTTLMSVEHLLYVEFP